MTLTAKGQLDIKDADGASEEQLVEQQHAQGSHGYFSVQKDGFWEYHLDNQSKDIQDLNSGDTLKDSIKVQSVDGTKHTISINILGQDDNSAPVLDNVITDRRGSGFRQGSIHFTDADHDTLRFTLVNGKNTSGSSSYDYESKGQYGTLKIDDKGRYLYEINHKGRVDHEHDTFEIKVDDGHGHEVIKYMTYEINGGSDGSRGWFSSSRASAPDIVHTDMTDTPPYGQVHDEAELTQDDVLIQLDTDLADAQHNIHNAQQVLHEAQNNHDTDAIAQAEAKIEQFTQITEELQAQKASLTHETEQANLHTTVDHLNTEDQVVNLDHENTEKHVVDLDHDNTILPTQEPHMPSLDNVAEHLDNYKNSANIKVTKEHLEIVATLLGDTNDAKTEHIVKAVENQEPKEHVANPDAPSHKESGAAADGSHDSHVDDNASEHHTEHIAPHHVHHLDDDIDHDDGSGLT
jgi:VCBS repeat-containing protein